MSSLTDRTCIVTREVMDPSDLIRFVAGPNDTVVPDLKRNLPGRGVWVSARKSCIEQAVSSSAFSRGLKSKVRAEQNLPELVEKLLLEAALGALGFARKAGQCITGAGKVENLVRSGEAIAVLHAIDGSEDGLRKVNQAAHATESGGGKRIRIWRIFSSTQLNIALGASNVIHAAVIEGGAARNFVSRAIQLSKYREMEPS